MNSISNFAYQCDLVRYEILSYLPEDSDELDSTIISIASLNKELRGIWEKDYKEAKKRIVQRLLPKYTFEVLRMCDLKLSSLPYFKDIEPTEFPCRFSNQIKEFNNEGVMIEIRSRLLPKGFCLGVSKLFKSNLCPNIASGKLLLSMIQIVGLSYSVFSQIIYPPVGYLVINKFFDQNRVRAIENSFVTNSRIYDLFSNPQEIDGYKRKRLLIPQEESAQRVLEMIKSQGVFKNVSQLCKLDVEAFSDIANGSDPDFYIPSIRPEVKNFYQNKALILIALVGLAIAINCIQCVNEKSA